MIEKLEIHHLRTLDALYKCGNLSAAAEKLGISQQAVSLQLKKLRIILADPLFSRTGHGVVPTQYARQLEAHVSNVLQLFNDIPMKVDIQPEEMKRTLVISATDYTQEVILGWLISKMREVAPQVKVIIASIESAQLTTKMQRGDIHLAFTTRGYVPDGLNFESLFTEKYQCVASSRFMKIDQSLSLKQLVENNFLVTSPGTGSFSGSADAWFEQLGCPRNVVLSVPSFNIAKQFLKVSNLVGFLPSRLLPCEGLVNIPLEKYPPGFEVVVVYPPSAKADPLIEWVLQQLESMFSSSI